MWDYDKTLDIYRYKPSPRYFLEVVTDKVFPGWKTLYLNDEVDDYSWKMKSDNVEAALAEAAEFLPKLIAKRAGDGD